MASMAGPRAVLAVVLLAVLVHGACAQQERDLFEACHRGDAMAVHRLLDDGVSPHAQDKDGWTCLHFVVAGARGHQAAGRQLVLDLFERGASDTLCVGDGEGLTPLHLAAQRGTAKMVALLAQDGRCSVYARDEDGRTPLVYACSRAAVNSVRALLAAGATVHVGAAAPDGGPEQLDCPSYAGVLGAWDVAEALLEHGMAVNAASAGGKTMLHRAAVFGRVAFADQLLQRGGVHVDAVDAQGRTPLHWAALHGHCHAAALLLTAGADPLRPDAQQQTALDLCDEGCRAVLSKAAAHGVSAAPAPTRRHGDAQLGTAMQGVATPALLVAALFTVGVAWRKQRRWRSRRVEKEHIV